ncbi:exodeoxyribonuclease III [Candidatus Falkowbacteria bacterium RIFOXYB2_FULL_34_18]|uniref:Exodeoxyribonuclease III n=1 Tax=Candidatus Falkowbacteria bacterium RIFOXYD2_FULL_34_120 TaxID=1798007 RepID=A0A1F5TM58_9BACT|nr:MAG: exodeoxyribonuclease III [Candidatus Falkowbacteria bacterium RIFOXYB2_FULL_34_18]OGF29141.1 MAG: exodeoxyribonuclease III [Candidatus Falkowbacteria bacterium RIFOXYC12_FULL_34_55]OGF36947.1 MAG: exodeoxyribonuclease III [Candidatus Falkowbacteria bacterium RIFOXYC2_FULL_34_220]OGF38663.1 MAG: exodeoxyribonuclease III [Candidatus Falkowbacteria bacterium RIFOXYD12_FULL_34_57]OGF39897.1 MAG: exodeoxyribonuclease III [Candidatus Falkowbacteria bacterium RIFOXYD2_FULL_34_120]
MKIISWNINGIRAVLKKGFLETLKKERADFLCLQEIKIDNKAISEQVFNFPEYIEFWNPADRRGYSGTAILAREGLKVEYLPRLKWDDEGRIQVLDIGKYYLVNIYFPNANHELSRLGFKIGFNDKLLKYLKRLEQKKPIIVCGDYNVAHEAIDLARPKQNVGSPGFTDEERGWMSKFLKNGFVDVFRYQHPDEAKYSWWSYRANARIKNIGWRIDYFCVSAKMIKQVKRSFIKNEILGSDHCPVGIEIK